MKLAKITLLSFFLMGFIVSNAQIGQLNKLKNKVNLDKSKSSDKKESTTTTDDTSDSENKPQSSGLSCDELVEKADGLYSTENYTDAWKYYEQAENDGCVGSMDGQSRMNMNACKKEVNTTPEQKAEQEAQINAIYANMEAQKYSSPKVEDLGSSGTFHDANMNKIVFSKSEIVKGAENASSMTNKFTTADNIYSRVYLNQSMANFSNDIGAFPYTSDYLYRFTIEGYTHPEIIGNNITINHFGNENFQKWTTFQLALSPQASDVKEYPEAEYNAMFWTNIYHLPEGSYNVKVELIYDIPADQEETSARDEINCRKWTTKFGAEKVIAAGTFSIDVKNADKLALSKKLSEGLPASAKSDAALAASMVKVTTGMWENQTPVKAVITSSDWKYHRDWRNIITHRTITGAVVIKFEKENVYKVFEMSFAEQNQGGDKYGPIGYDGPISDYIIAKELIK